MARKQRVKILCVADLIPVRLDVGDAKGADLFENVIDAASMLSCPHAAVVIKDRYLHKLFNNASPGVSAVIFCIVPAF